MKCVRMNELVGDGRRYRQSACRPVPTREQLRLTSQGYHSERFCQYAQESCRHRPPLSCRVVTASQAGEEGGRPKDLVRWSGRVLRPEDGLKGSKRDGCSD